MFSCNQVSEVSGVSLESGIRNIRRFPGIRYQKYRVFSWNRVSEILGVFLELVSESDAIVLISDLANVSPYLIVRLMKVLHYNIKSINWNTYLFSSVYLSLKTTLQTCIL